MADDDDDIPSVQRTLFLTSPALSGMDDDDDDDDEEESDNRQHDNSDDDDDDDDDMLLSVLQQDEGPTEWAASPARKLRPSVLSAGDTYLFVKTSPLKVGKARASPGQSKAAAMERVTQAEAMLKMVRAQRGRSVVAKRSVHRTEKKSPKLAALARKRSAKKILEACQATRRAESMQEQQADAAAQAAEQAAASRVSALVRGRSGRREAAKKRVAGRRITALARRRVAAKKEQARESAALIAALYRGRATRQRIEELKRLAASVLDSDVTTAPTAVVEARVQQRDEVGGGPIVEGRDEEEKKMNMTEDRMTIEEAEEALQAALQAEMNMASAAQEVGLPSPSRRAEIGDAESRILTESLTTTSAGTAPREKRRRKSSGSPGPGPSTTEKKKEYRPVPLREQYEHVLDVLSNTGLVVMAAGDNNNAEISEEDKRRRARLDAAAQRAEQQHEAAAVALGVATTHLAEFFHQPSGPHVTSAALTTQSRHLRAAVAEAETQVSATHTVSAAARMAYLRSLREQSVDGKSLRAACAQNKVFVGVHNKELAADTLVMKFELMGWVRRRRLRTADEEEDEEGGEDVEATTITTAADIRAQQVQGDNLLVSATRALNESMRVLDATTPKKKEKKKQRGGGVGGGIIIGNSAAEDDDVFHLLMMGPPSSAAAASSAVEN